MNPAKLDTRIQLSRKVPAPDSAGGLTFTKQQFADIWAEKIDQGSTIFSTLGVVNSETTTMFRVRFFEIADADFILTAGGIDYKLTVPPYEVEGRRKYLLMQARRLQ